MKITFSAFVPGTNGFNKVKSDGTLWSCRKRGGRNAKNRKGKWHKQKLTLNRDGYLQATLKINGKKTIRKIHVLMLLSFVGPRPERHWARHYPDRTKTNVALSNLSWADYETNMRDKIEHGTDSRGEKQGSAKLTWRKVRKIRRLYKTGNWSKTRLAKRFHVTKQNISKIIKMVTWVE